MIGKRFRSLPFIFANDNYTLRMAFIIFRYFVYFVYTFRIICVIIIPGRGNIAQLGERSPD